MMPNDTVNISMAIDLSKYFTIIRNPAGCMLRPYIEYVASDSVLNYPAEPIPAIDTRPTIELWLELYDQNPELWLPPEDSRKLRPEQTKASWMQLPSTQFRSGGESLTLFGAIAERYPGGKLLSKKLSSKLWIFTIVPASAMLTELKRAFPVGTKSSIRQETKISVATERPKRKFNFD